MAPSAFEPPHIILPTTHHSHTIIALHGRGSQGPEFADELFEEKTSLGLNLRQTFPSCKWVFPSSQERYSTVFQEELDEWFDIYSLTDPAAREELQLEGLRDSINFLQALISDEVNIMTSDRVILLGLSQGSATGLLTLLASTSKIGAYIGLNGWMPFKTHVEKCQGREDLATFFNTIISLNVLDTQPEEGSMLETPIFLAHNTDDEIIDVQLGQQARDVLLGLGMKTIWEEEKEGGHLGMLKTKGLDSMVAFLQGAVGLPS